MSLFQNTDEALAHAIALRRFGASARVSRMSQTTGPVYHIHTPQRRCILKLGKSATDRSIAKEAFIIDLLHRHRVPAPVVDFCGVEPDLERRPFLLMRSAGERTVMDALIPASTDAQSLVAEMGSVLAAFHGITLPTAGDIQAAHIVPHDLGAQIQRLHGLADWAVAQHLVTPDDARLFKSLPPPPIDGNSLCHMDFNAVHCIVCDGRISAVVDWESAWAANPLIDLAVAQTYLEYHCPGDLVQRFLNSYAMLRPLPPDYASIYLPARLAHLLGMMWVWSGQRLVSNVERASRMFTSLCASAPRSSP